MKKLLVFAAAAALFAAAPAFAQPNDEHHERGGRRGGSPSAMSAQHPDRNPNHGNTGAQRSPATPQPAPPAAVQPNSAMMQHNNRDRNRAGDNTPRTGNMAGPNRGMAGPNRDTRGRDSDRHNGMRGPSRNAGNANSQRRNAANFSRYHRNFNSPRRYRAPSYRRPRGWYSHRWTFGERLPSAFFARNYWINDFLDYGLLAPPYGTVWVRYGSDALLIDEYSGEVIQVAYNVFY